MGQTHCRRCEESLRHGLAPVVRRLFMKAPDSHETGSAALASLLPDPPRLRWVNQQETAN
jgi:hypothetical protein